MLLKLSVWSLYISYASILAETCPASLFSAQAHIGKQGLVLDSVSLSADAMPGDPAVVEEARVVLATLSAPELLTAVAVKLPTFWPDNIETWLIQSK